MLILARMDRYTPHHQSPDFVRRQHRIDVQSIPSEFVGASYHGFSRVTS
jgi:hypothetical protein